MSASLPLFVRLTAATALAVGLLTGCAGGQRPNTLPDVDPPSEAVDLDPTLIRADVDDQGEVTGSESIDSGEVFKEAQRAFRKRQYEVALEKYAVIIQYFEDSDFYLAALYNSGLAYDYLKRHEEAAKMYRGVVERFKGRQEATDAYFRLAGSLSHLGRHREVMSVLDELEGRTGLSLADKVELHARRGDALLGLEKLADAESSYRKALMTHRRADPEIALPSDAFFVVAAQYGVARVYHELFLAIKFRLPLERMEKDLDDKIEIFQQAQALYVRTIRQGHPHWTTASRYQIARMYENFYSDLLASEIPELTDEEAELYFEELRKKLRPLMDQALQYYERTITLSERQGIDNEYTERTEEALERLKRYLTDPSLQEADEAAVRSGDTPPDLGTDAAPVRPEPLAPEGEDDVDEGTLNN